MPSSSLTWAEIIQTPLCSPHRLPQIRICPWGLILNTEHPQNMTIIKSPRHHYLLLREWHPVSAMSAVPIVKKKWEARDPQGHVMPVLQATSHSDLMQTAVTRLPMSLGSQDPSPSRKVSDRMLCYLHVNSPKSALDRHLPRHIDMDSGYWSTKRRVSMLCSRPDRRPQHPQL